MEDEIILGQENIRYLKEFFKDGINMQDIQAYIKLDDVIDEAKKQTMNDMALAAINAQQISFLDALKALNFKTTTELEDYLTYAFDMKKKEQEAAAARAAIEQQMARDQEVAAKQQAAETQAMGRVEAAQAGAESGIARAAIQSGAQTINPEDAAAMEGQGGI